MKVKQVLQWIVDNNVDSVIDGYIKTKPARKKTIEVIEAYIDEEFTRMGRQQDEIDKDIEICRTSITPENATKLIELIEKMIEIGDRMNDLNMIATYIEKHKPE